MTMAERLKNFEFKAINRVDRPWQDWLDGSVWKLYQADIGDTTFSRIADAARERARKKGLRVRTSITKATDEAEGFMVLQAYPADNGTLPPGPEDEGETTREGEADPRTGPTERAPRRATRNGKATKATKAPTRAPK